MIVLAGAGGEVASAAAKLAEETGAEVVTLVADLGGHPTAGGSNRDAATFADDHCLPAIQANALVTGLAWPAVVRRLADAARRCGATTVAHGYTGRGAHRFAAGLAAVAPDLRVLAVPGAPPAERTLWGYVVEPGDRWRFPAEGEFLAPEEVTVTFDSGVPVAVDGETVSVAEALRRLNRRAAAQGAGKHRTEDGRTFAAPGALVLVTAHRALESGTLEPELARFKRRVDREWATLVRDGQWFSPLKHALDSFVVEAQEAVSGDVRLLLHDGRVTALEPRDARPAAEYVARPGRITAQA
ncbi:argininosuccinate synthase domain-containing protein [Amycolatopsis sp. cmx-8-4]|uniref:argininosuccinate synthase domain-containing protein n=1 Tax=Amycolatopsis sp. cmx-8-4 TaxID=2790947 RepID=UPI00397D53C9